MTKPHSASVALARAKAEFINTYVDTEEARRKTTTTEDIDVLRAEARELWAQLVKNLYTRWG